MTARTEAITLRQMRAFLAVVEHGSFTRAAEVQNLTQPALTASIKQLEGHLGHALLTRGRQTEATDEGRRFLSAIRPRLQDLAEAMAVLNTPANAAHLSVACTNSVSSAFLADRLPDFIAARPDLNVELLCGTSRDVAEHIEAGRADLGICVAGARGGLVARPFFSEPLGLLVHKDHPLAGCPTLSWSRILDQPLLDLGFRSVIEAGFAGSGLPPPQWSERQYIIRNPRALARVIDSAAELAVLPALAVMDGEFRHHAFIPLEQPVTHREIVALSRTRTLNGTMASLLSFLAAGLSEPLVMTYSPQ